jgi:hypothetical protein
MSAYLIIGYLITAFGLGYAGGSLIRITRRVIESCD